MTDFEQGTIDVALDKCALDALLHGSLWDPSDDVKENVGKYVNEVWRILKKGGSWICVTFRQPHFIRNLLKKDKEAGEHGGWESITQETLTEGGCFEYFGWVLRK